MFEIRVICTPADMVRISTALGKAFQTGPFRSVPTRDGQSRRLYVTADHREQTGPWPAPEAAYAKAPGIVSEIGWTAQTARTVTYGPDGITSQREFWLRKAALLDRIALDDEAAGTHADASELALKAARFLIDLDGAAGPDPDDPHGPAHLECRADPRGYVRREYARYTRTLTESE
ncbi:hypothetical protein [Streptomyces sp. NBC_00827]|uniref:hypothetical protein n=1 Tax=Streptomyces sp. NBC_00827 TaxID=2903677 RepID=UPI00386AC5CD|nr:hypothetical protein OG569_10090 [Streptomyces sp. NBC_00827]